MDSEVRTVVKSVCLELGIKEDTGKAIVDTLFKQLRENMKSADLDDPDSYKNFRIINFGIFYSDPYKRASTIKHLNYESKES